MSSGKAWLPSLDTHAAFMTWRPWQTYADTAFEQILLEDYRRLYATNTADEELMDSRSVEVGDSSRVEWHHIFVTALVAYVAAVLWCVRRAWNLCREQMKLVEDEKDIDVDRVFDIDIDDV